MSVIDDIVKNKTYKNMDVNTLKYITESYFKEKNNLPLVEIKLLNKLNDALGLSEIGENKLYINKNYFILLSKLTIFCKSNFTVLIETINHELCHFNNAVTKNHKISQMNYSLLKENIINCFAPKLLDTFYLYFKDENKSEIIGKCESINEFKKYMEFKDECESL